MSISPNTAGFFAASAQLRTMFGDTLVFHVPQPPTYDASVKINPDTGDPYNAMAVQTNVEFVDVPIVASVILKQASPLRPQADAMFEEAGLMSGMDIIADVADGDYQTVQTASEFTYTIKVYRVEEWKPFEMAGTLYRWLAYAKER